MSGQSAGTITLLTGAECSAGARARKKGAYDCSYTPSLSGSFGLDNFVPLITTEIDELTAHLLEINCSVV
jgi:hypothetical protein